jgi:hypothetical protein
MSVGVFYGYKTSYETKGKNPIKESLRCAACVIKGLYQQGPTTSTLLTLFFRNSLF